MQVRILKYSDGILILYLNRIMKFTILFPAVSSKDAEEAMQSGNQVCTTVCVFATACREITSYWKSRLMHIQEAICNIQEAICVLVSEWGWAISIQY